MARNPTLPLVDDNDPFNVEDLSFDIDSAPIEIDDVSFYLPDLIVESVIREGFMVMKRNTDIVDHVFRSLAKGQSDLINKKYGKKELERIKRVIAKYDWSIVHSFNEVEANLPCVSIQLLNETESREVNVEDFDFEAQIPLPDEDLAALIVLQGFTPLSFNPITGIIVLPNSLDLSNVHVNLLFVDAAGNEFPIIGGIVNQSSYKQVMVAINSVVNVSGPCLIKSSVNYQQVVIRNIRSDVNLLLGIHSKDALLTKYFYILVKYFLMARKAAMIERGLDNVKFQGSDFTRDLRFEGDAVFNRFLTVSGKTQDSFRSDLSDVFDNINIIVEVPVASATTEELGLQDSTVQVGTDSQDEPEST